MVGAVLCGGASRRMGVDKATLPIAGTAMARHVANALTDAGCSPVVTIGGSAGELDALGLEHVNDEFPGEGPLGGILTALALGTPAVVVACDLPNLRAATIKELIAALAGHDAAMAFSDRPEPLCAVWSADAIPVLRAQFESGERAVHRAIRTLDITSVTVSPTELRNINSPEDLGSL